MKKRGILILYIVFMVLVILPVIVGLWIWNEDISRMIIKKEAFLFFQIFTYLLISFIVIWYGYFIYVTSASLWFYLTYKHTGAKCYYFSGDKLYIHSRFSPIPIEKIENITIKKYSQADRSYGFKVLVKLKGKRLRQQFRLGIAGFIRTDLQKLHDDLIKDFRKRKIEYKYR